jgi:hypothetical protein
MGTMSDLLISKPPFSSFFVNIKQYRPELESLMTLNLKRAVAGFRMAHLAKITAA